MYFTTFVEISGVKSEPKTVFLEPKPVPHLQHLHNSSSQCHNDVNSNVPMTENNNSMPEINHHQHSDEQDHQHKDPLCDSGPAANSTAINDSHEFYP